MRLLLLSVGHKAPEWVNSGFMEYAKRMPREARIELVELKPEPRASGKTPQQIMEAEAKRILAALPKGGRFIALDERGSSWSTRQLADRMGQWMEEGGDVAFVVGGADGLHETVKQSAHHLLSLSAMTLPHAMVRVLMAEQLYRAYSLLHNHPYHRE
jgi:23S rRNA (pseudouridine1915-N3)-methyltransferase